MDAVFKSEFHYQNHSGELTHKVTQPTENLILSRNAELRKNEGIIKDLGAESGDTWGRQVATIPMILLDKAIRDGYDINNRDSEVASKELYKWLQTTTEGQSCMIREKL